MFHPNMLNTPEGVYAWNRHLWYMQNIPGYSEMWPSERKEARKQCCKKGRKIMQYSLQNFCLGNLQTASYTTTVCIPQEEEKETIMNTTQTYRDSETYMQRDYLIHRLRDAYFMHERDSENRFGLRDEDTPCTGTEMVQRIKDGQFTIQKYDPEDADSADYIRWRDPNLKTDRPGHRAWMKKVEEAHENAKNEIMVFPPERALETLKAFKDLKVQ